MAWFDCATRKPVRNHSGPMAANFGLILHHAVALGSLASFFDNPASGVSAHFWVGLDGRIEQYVDSALTAWHAKQLNSRYCGVETEGCAQAPYAEPMTPAMVDALARVYGEGARRHGWPNALANSDGAKGFGFHRMAVNTACPCDVRLERRGEILAKAFGPAGGAPPAPSREGTPNMVCLDARTGGTWVATPDGSVFAYDGAPYLGGANTNPPNPGRYPCVGIAAWQTGYLLVLDWGDRGDGKSADGGDRFRRYRFARK